MKNWLLTRSIIYLIFLLASTVALAFQLTVSEDHPFGLFYDDEKVFEVTGGHVQAEFLFDIPEEHYLYREKIRIVVETPGVSGELSLPPGQIKYDEFLSKETQVYHHELVVPVVFTLSDSVAVPESVRGKLIFQGCSGKICFRAMRQPFLFKTSSQNIVSPSASRPDLSSLQKSGDKEPSFWDYVKPGRFEDVLARGLGFSLWITFLAGLLTAFTPCVLPVIPLTLTFMGVSRRQPVFDKIVSLIFFVVGLVLMYATLGVLSAWLGKTLGFWFQSIWFQIFLVVFFLLMGLWMLGVLQLNVSSRLQTRLARYHPKGHLAQLYSGLTIGFLAAPCVGPIIGPLLIYISLSRDVFLGFVLMLSFSLGLSVLFFLLGFFSQTWVRRFGEKSEWIKKVLGGFLLLTAAFYLWWIIKPHLGFQDHFFLNSLSRAESVAKAENKGLIVDFYADWCLPCHQWDRVIWSNEQVQNRVLEDFVPVKIDCTQDTKECENASSRFGIIGMPTVVFLGRDQNEIHKSRLVGREMTAAEFVEHLKHITESR